MTTTTQQASPTFGVIFRERVISPRVPGLVIGDIRQAPGEPWAAWDMYGNLLGYEFRNRPHARMAVLRAHRAS